MMNKRWQMMGGLSLLVCMLLVGCGGTSNGGEMLQQEGESHQVEKIEQEDTEEDTVEKRQLNDLQPPEGIDYVIADEYFVRDTDELYNHLKDYVGKILQYEGMVTRLDADRTAIIRLYDLAHEEHAHEILVGLDAVYAGTWPEEKTWVRVIGVIEEGVDQDSGEAYPVLQVLKLEEIEKGQEKVYN